ncbi:hypothetical protein BG004_001684 [Podila humilis]|nr:hypothetical protein BG004_001684 [Podila humilis]
MPVDQVDILGQQVSLNIYTQLTLCYPVKDESALPAILSTLNAGLDRLVTVVPWAGGQVVVEGATKNNSGMSVIRPLDYNEMPKVIVKDLRNDPSAPTMQTLKDAEFPMSMLDENMLCPRNTLPGTAGEPLSRPVFMVQATIVKGGLLLTFVGQHQVMDMIGQHVLMDLLNKACHPDVEFTKEEMDNVNVARENIIPLLPDTTTETGLEHQVVPPAPAPAPASAPASEQKDVTAVEESSAPPKSSSWAYFSFDANALASLKSLANASLPSSTSSTSASAGFISTDDALSALIWQSIARARLARFSPTVECTFGRAVDMRKFLNLSPTYPGVVQILAYSSGTLQQLAHQDPLGVIAARLRASLDKDTLSHNIIAASTFLHRTMDKWTIYILKAIDLDVSMMLSSWAKLEGCWSLDFNMGLGPPIAVRRPRFTPFPSLMYLMPKSPQGEISAAICALDEDLERLKNDKEFVKFARFIG